MIMVPLEGPVGIGALANAVMLGCAIVQSCLYYKNPRGDMWLFKILVSLILFLLLSHLGCMAAWLWASSEIYSGKAPVPDYATILFGLSSIFGATILFLERCFFSYRILKAFNSHMLAFFFFVCCIFSFTAALGAASVSFSNATPSLLSQLSNNWIFPLDIICGLICDLAISVTVGFYLRFQMRTGMVYASGRVTRLSLWIAETSTVTGLFDIAIVIVYWLTRKNFAWVSLAVVMPGVFSNTLLAALNARGQLCADIEQQRISSNVSKLIDHNPRRPPILIAISKEVEKQSEKIPV